MVMFNSKLISEAMSDVLFQKKLKVPVVYGKIHHSYWGKLTNFLSNFLWSFLGLKVVFSQRFQPLGSLGSLGSRSSHASSPSKKPEGKSHKNTIQIPWKSHENPMNIPWKSHENPMKIPWTSHENHIKSHENPMKSATFFGTTYLFCHSAMRRRCSASAWRTFSCNSWRPRSRGWQRRQDL